MDSSKPQIGNYRLTRLLGTGANADVYIGEDIHLKELAAIKIFHTGFIAEDRESREAFLREAQMQASMNHPNIVGIKDFGFDNVQGQNLPYLVMDYAPLGTLRERHPRGSIVPLETVVSYVKQIASALQYTHDQKLIHRDVKPENMLFTADDKLLISDFGLAIIMQDSSYEQSNQGVAGTLAYMAPEQFQGHPQAASDQYALGIVVYEWLTGQLPFQGTFVEIMAQHLHTTPLSLRSKNSAIPPTVEQVVLKALAKEPQQRYLSVQAFADALEQAYQQSLNQSQPLSPQNLEGQQLGNYRIVRLLRESDFGNLYLGEHISTHEQATVRVLQDLQKLARFRKEVAINSRMRHPNIVPYIEAETNGEVPFLTTAYTPYGTLAERHPRGTTLPLTVIVSYVKQAATALQYMHDQGYMHLNVKPDLLFIGERENILLGNFVVAAAIGDTEVSGTPHYMAPEQFAGRPVPASDQYGLAVSVYEWLAGTLLFNATNFDELRRQHQSLSPPPLQLQNEAIPFAVEVVVRKALSKEPQQRYSSVQEFADALERAYLQSPTPEGFVGQQLGSYRLIRFLRQSVFGNIYLGEHITTSEQAVIKVLRNIDQEELTRFLREIRIHSSMHHPSILRFIEADSNGDFPFLTTAFAPHGTLAARYDVGEIIPLTTIIAYVKQIAAALQYVHEQGYIHLNVKPESLFIGANDEILLGSFAIAVPIDQSEGVSGSLLYMAPEQFEGKPVPASDQYGLGITVYTWLSGVLPFQGTGIDELRRQHTSVTPPSLLEQNIECTPELDRVIMQALAKEPQARFRSIQEFANILIYLWESIVTPPIPRYERIRDISPSFSAWRIWLARDTNTKTMVTFKMLGMSTFDHSYQVPNGVFYIEDMTWSRTLDNKMSYEQKKSILEQEIAIAQSLKHPNILPVLDSGYVVNINNGKFPYFVTPYIHDGSLAQYIEHTQPWETWSLEQIMDVLLQAASALEYLHTSTPAIVHRDSKPSNFLISQEQRPNSVAHIYLADFGIAHRMDRPNETDVAGTPAYMAPEQFDGYFSPASDQYSLALMACYLLTGKYPFADTSFAFETPSEITIDDEDRQSLILRAASIHKNTQPIAPTVLNPTRITSTQIDAVIFRALAKQPEHRFPSVTAFINELLSACMTQQDFATAPVFTAEGEYPQTPPATISYRVFMATTPSIAVTIGSSLEVTLYLSSVDDDYEVLEKMEEVVEEGVEDIADEHVEDIADEHVKRVRVRESDDYEVLEKMEKVVEEVPSEEYEYDYDSVGYSFEVPYEEISGGELNILLNTSGFQLQGENAASLPLMLPVADTTPLMQVARFSLVALRPGPAVVSAEVYHGATFLTTLDADVEVTGIDADEQAAVIATPLLVRPRPVPQPDLLFQVRTEWNAEMSSCILHYTLRSFQATLAVSEEPYHSPSLAAGWIERSRQLLGSMLEECAGAAVEDMRMRLISLGSSLFRKALPLTLQNELRNLARVARPLTLLIVADQDAWLPWELLYLDYGFLGEQFVIGRWLHELDAARPYEFPLGGMHVAHYANVPQPEAWVDLLSFPELPEPLMLPGGVFADLASAETMHGLYMMRYGQAKQDSDMQDAPVQREMANGQNSVEKEVRPMKLSLRRNRPLVSLGYIRAETAELTTLEQAWIPTFIRAGCSAFVGPLWSVQPSIQAAFMSGFYRRLWAGDAVAEAFQTGRALAKAVAPDSLDWLSYVLVGDPMARPYRPVVGQGYALVEPIGRELDDPVPPGGSARFRLSLRRTPPVWHEERVIEVAETLHFEHLQVYIIAFGLEVKPEPPIDMTLTPGGDYFGWCSLQVPTEISTKEILVQVHFVDNMQPIHSLSFTLNVIS